MPSPPGWSGSQRTVRTSAGTAQEITLKEGEIVLTDLDEPAPPDALPATVTDGREAGGTLCGRDVAAMLVRSEALALTAVALGTGADAHLVERARLGTTRDEVTPAALVAIEDLVAVKLEDAEPSQDVSGGSFVRWLR